MSAASGTTPTGSAPICWIHKLEVDIFGHTHTYDPHYQADKQAEEGQGSDVFFDAFPIKPDNDGHLVGLENITSHLSSEPGYDGLAKINPITLLKVMPGVVFFFRFLLHDSEIRHGEESVTITADEKLAFFKKIIADFGMGAKTNVGFGLLEEFTPSISATYLRSTVCSQRSGTSMNNNASPASNSMNEAQTSSSAPAFAYTEGKVYDAVIVEVKKKQLKVQLKEDDETKPKPIIKQEDIPPDQFGNVNNLTQNAVFRVGKACRVRYCGCRPNNAGGNDVPVFRMEEVDKGVS